MRNLKNIASLRTMLYRELWVGLPVQCTNWNQIHKISTICSENFIAINKHQSETDKWNRKENPKINPDTCGQLIFEKGGENIK